MKIEDLTKRTDFPVKRRDLPAIKRQFAAFNGSETEFCEMWLRKCNEETRRMAREMLRQAMHKVLLRVYYKQGYDSPATIAIRDYYNLFCSATADVFNDVFKGGISNEA